MKTLALALLFASMFAATACRQKNAPPSAELKAAADAYRKAGLPWVKKDLEPKPPIKNGQNAAPVLIQAYKALPDHTSLFYLKGENLQGKVKACGNALALTEKAVELPAFYWGADTIDIFPLEAGTRELARALGLRARLRASKGDAAGCVSDLGRTWKLGQLLGQEPSAVAQIAGESICEMGLGTAAQCAQVFESDAAGLHALEDATGRLENRIDANRGYYGDAYEMLSLFRHTPSTREFVGKILGGSTAGQPEGDGTYPQNPPEAPHFFDAWFRAWAEAWPQVQRLQGEPLQAARVRQMAFEKYGKDQPQEAKSMFEGASEGSATSIVRLSARLIDTRAMFAAIDFKQRTGAFPAAIDQLPGRWTDPFTGKPLMLKRTDTGIRIYSVGMNGKDEGGAWDRNKEGTRDDVSVEYPPPPAR